MISPNGARLTLENILNKINVKLGGLNYFARMPTVEKSAQLENCFKLESNEVLVIGYDVSHPTQKVDICLISLQHLILQCHVRTKSFRSNQGSIDSDKMDVEEATDDKENEISSLEPSVVGVIILSRIKLLNIKHLVLRKYYKKSGKFCR